MTAPAPRTYSLHGLRLLVAGWEPAVAGVDARLRRLAVDGGGGDGGGRENARHDEKAGALRFEIRNGDGPPPTPPGRGRPVYDPPDGRVLYWDGDDLLYIEIGTPGRDTPETGAPSGDASKIGALHGNGPEIGTFRVSTPAIKSSQVGSSHTLAPHGDTAKLGAPGGARAQGFSEIDIPRKGSPERVSPGDAGPRLAALCRLGEGRVEIAALRPRPGDLWLLSHPLFTLPLCELAKRRGLYSLHAGGLCRDGRALLLPGASGAGKSTLSVALARAGFGLLGDDTVFLRRGPGGPRVLGFPDEVDLTAESVTLLSVDLLPDFPLEGARKRSLGPERLAAGGLVAECAPGWLVFPRISGRRESALAPMSRDEALLALAPDVLLTEPRSSQAHLDALAELVAASECLRLATGSDLAGAVRLLEELTRLR